MATVESWIRENLNHRIMSNADLAYHKLRDLEPLIAPLNELTKPGELLVLCPTWELHHLPLHAVAIDDEQILLERNPVVYTPSLTVLHHLGRLNQSATLAAAASSSSLQPAVVISVYENDGTSPNQAQESRKVKQQLKRLSRNFGATLQSGPHVTVPFWEEYTRDAGLIHFHGHALSDDKGENQSLVLQPDHNVSISDTTDTTNSSHAGHHLTARKVLSMNFTQNPLVVNIACGSSKAELKPGDELFGLTAAFLLSGANSVVGTMWPIESADGRTFTAAFYDDLVEQSIKLKDESSSRPRPVVDVARALQRAVLEIRDNEETEAPYHWAASTLSGLWKSSFFVNRFV
ncbi:CHAT domain-containing protein [Kalaharituber pfeilii]|nr:CHAT domain-containing protein [Kalaharituber pfeilii]